MQNDFIDKFVELKKRLCNIYGVGYDDNGNQTNPENMGNLSMKDFDEAYKLRLEVSKMRVQLLHDALVA